MKQTCGNCICYLDDTDENGNVTNYHHDRNKDEGFCAIQPLFTVRKKDDGMVRNTAIHGGVNYVFCKKCRDIKKAPRGIERRVDLPGSME